MPAKVPANKPKVSDLTNIKLRVFMQILCERLTNSLSNCRFLARKIICNKLPSRHNKLHHFL